MRHLTVYADASVIGGCEDPEFANLGRIRLFNSVNIEWGYGLVEIRSPKEVLEYE